MTLKGIVTLLFISVVGLSACSKGKTETVMEKATQKNIAFEKLMGVPDGETQVLVKMNSDGDMKTIYHIGSGESRFYNFAINPSQDMLYLTNLTLGQVYRTPI